LAPAGKWLGKKKLDMVNSVEAAAWVAFSRAMLNLDHFVTGE